MSKHHRNGTWLAALLLIGGSGMASTDAPRATGVVDLQIEPTARQTRSSKARAAETDLVRLEDSLQWTSRKPVELPVSLFVTDLLPGKC
ncbi:MAG: hypothetical protein ACR2QV_10230 [Gammaproteobacteria bacterium]